MPRAALTVYVGDWNMALSLPLNLKLLVLSSVEKTESMFFLSTFHARRIIGRKPHMKTGKLIWDYIFVAGKK